MMVHFIAFTGMQGSGKTTLMENAYICLKEDGKRVVKLNSVSRQMIEALNIDLNELRKNREGLKAWQYLILRKHFNEVEKFEKKNSYGNLIVLMDRSYLDFQAYNMMYLGDQYVKKTEKLFTKEINNFKAKSTIFYLDSLNNREELSDNVRDLVDYDDEEKFFEKIALPNVSYHIKGNEHGYRLMQVAQRLTIDRVR